MQYTKDAIIELLSNMNEIYERIAELYDDIQDGDYIEKEYILEKLAEIQNLTRV